MTIKASASGVTDLRAKATCNAEIVLVVKREDVVRLEALGRGVEGDPSEVFRRALDLLTVAVDAVARGDRIVVMTPGDRVLTEITGISVPRSEGRDPVDVSPRVG